jgi:outer membrane protein assembly factor BamB
MRSAIIILLLALAAGCVPTHLRESVRVRPTDWTLEGGDPGRTNVARETLAPPLALRWESDASAGFGPGSAVSSDSVVFVANMRGEVHAFRDRDGEKTGVRDFGAAVAGTPVLGRRLLYVALTREDQSVVGYDLENGVVAWTYAAGDVGASPLLVGTRLVVASIAGTVTCLDAATGEKRWSYASSAPRRSVGIRSAPSSDGTLVFVGRDDGSLLALGLEDGLLRWTAHARSAINAATAAGGGRVVAASLDGSVRGFDAATGECLWETPLGSPIFGAPALRTDTVFIGTSGGSVAALSASSGAVLWRAEIKGPVSCAPLVSGGVVYLGSLDRSLSAFDAATGERLWHLHTEGRIKSTPMIADGLLIVLVEDRRVLAFEHEVTP